MKKVLGSFILLASFSIFGMETGEFESLQWGLRNPGTPIDLKLTDIDRLTIPARAGEDINLGSVKEIEGRKIRVAVIDSGIDLNHPDFKSIIYRNEGECTAWDAYQACLNKADNEEEPTKSCHEKWAKTDTDNNGYPMDCRGWNVAAPVNPLTGIQGNNDVMDIVGHGTHISGIIGALQDNFGVSGVIRNVEILPVKVSGSTETVEEDNTTDIFAKGILYALKQNVDVINLSVGWSSSQDSLLVAELIQKAHEMGVLVVVAGGNSAHSTETYPCAYNEVICVGAHNPDGSRSHFSNFGSSIDVFAPGHNILSTWPLELRPKIFTVRHGFEFKNGTSFSAPYVVGILARLLNLGFSPDEARVKLLAGSRRGNADFSQAVAFSAKSFIYPVKKSAAFVNWHEGEKKVVLKLKNYVKAAANVQVSLVSKINSVVVKDDTKSFPAWNQDEIKDLTFILQGDDSAPSEINFDLIITSADEKKSYPIQAVATTVIHDRFSRADTKRSGVQTNRDLEAFDFLPFENIHTGLETDLLISQIVDGKLAIGLIKKIGDTYRLARLQSTIFDKSLIIQAAKVDLDLNGTAEYVITGMYQNKDTKWVAKFYIFDENFRPSDLKICPENEHVNLIASMGTELKWMKSNDRMVPVWMAEGFVPSIDLPPLNPWVSPVMNAIKKRIYYLDQQGLRSFSLPTTVWGDFSPIALFNQSLEDLKSGNLQFVYTVDQGFKKKFLVSDTSTKESPRTFVMERYQNIFPLEGRSHNNSAELIFSETDSITGEGRLSVLNPLSTTIEQKDYQYDDSFDPIQLILNKTKLGSIFAHTKYNLLYMNGDNVYKTESRNASHLIQYKRIQNKEGMYLSSLHTPGLSSELVLFDERMLIRPAKYRFLVGTGCKEIGHHYSIWEKQDQILFYCDRSKSIIQIKI